MYLLLLSTPAFAAFARVIPTTPTPGVIFQIVASWATLIVFVLYAKAARRAAGAAK